VDYPQGAVVTQSALEPQSSVFQDVPTTYVKAREFRYSGGIYFTAGVQIFKRYLLWSHKVFADSSHLREGNDGVALRISLLPKINHF
jgi:hypothetical protein